MTMDEDNRRGDNPEEEESESGWYFELPKGAWERQEAKNRELRQSLRRNMNTEEPKKDVFGGKVGGQQPEDDEEDEQPSSWGALRHDRHEDEERPSTWSFERSRREHSSIGWFGADEESTDDDGDEGASTEYSTEPEISSPAPFKLRSQRLPEEDATPQLKPPPGLFTDEEKDGRPAVSGVGEDVSAEPAALVRRPAPETEPEEPKPFVPERQEAEAEQPRSRWGEFFGEPASEDTSMLEGMRSWASGKEPQRRTEPSPEVPEEAPHRAQQETTGPGDASEPSVPLRPRARDEEPETPAAAEDAPTSRWDEMFAAKPGDDAGLLEGMRAWAAGSGGTDEPETPRMRLADAPTEMPGELFEPFEWEKRAGDEPELPLEGRAQEDEGKGGLAGKLFGRRRKDEPDDSPTSTQWFIEEEEPTELPPAMSVGAGEEPTGSWLGRSDGSETQFGGADERPDADTEFRWEPTIGHDPDLDRRGEPEGAAKTDAGRAGLPSSVPNEAGRERRGGVEQPGPGEDTWRPEPTGIEPTIGEPAQAFASPDAGSMDDDPWEPVEAIEDESASPGTPDTTGLPSQPEGGSWADFAERIKGQPRQSDDPWAAFAAERARRAEQAEEPRKAEPAEEGSSLWDSAFARVHDPALESEEDATGSDEEAAESAADDPWATIAEVSGYDAAPGGIAVYRGTEQVEQALDRYEAERDAEEARSRYEAELAAQDERPATDERAPEEPEEEDELPPLAAAAAYPTGFDIEDEPRPISLPEWDDSRVVDDTVLRAFEAHASAYRGGTLDTEDDEADPAREAVFDDLLGEDADEIVAEASEPSPESQYFGRMQGWAPQRTTASGERQPYPWEVDREQPSREPDDRDDEDDSIGGWGYQHDSGPPWAGESTAPDGGHTGGPSTRQRSRSRMLVREIVETGLLALLVFLAVRASFQNFKVDGLSMWPTLDDGEYLIVNKLAYAEVDMSRLSNFVPFVDPGSDPQREVFGGPERGDIVVLKNPAEPDVDLIKRIVGLPGETLEIVDGKVYINDHLLIEPYIKQEWHDTKPKIAIPEGYYFVMGDNRENSSDSRSARVGLIPKDLIIGKAVLTYWPKSKFGLAPNESGDISEKDGRPELTTQTVP